MNTMSDDAKITDATTTATEAETLLTAEQVRVLAKRLLDERRPQQLEQVLKTIEASIRRNPSLTAIMIDMLDPSTAQALRKRGFYVTSYGDHVSDILKAQMMISWSSYDNTVAQSFREYAGTEFFMSRQDEYEEVVQACERALNRDPVTYGAEFGRLSRDTIRRLEYAGFHVLCFDYDRPDHDVAKTLVAWCKDKPSV